MIIKMQQLKRRKRTNEEGSLFKDQLYHFQCVNVSVYRLIIFYGEFGHILSFKQFTEGIRDNNQTIVFGSND